MRSKGQRSRSMGTKM